MSYLDETDPGVVADILYRKEFRLFHQSLDEIQRRHKRQEEDAKENIIPRFLIKKHIPAGNYLELHSYQLFVRNFMNPNTNYSRLLLKWETGLGKTVGALSIALNFINFYQKQEVGGDSSVYIIGFTQNIFRDELLRYPEFGFVSRAELEKLERLKKNAQTGSQASIENLKKFQTAMRRRLTNRRGNGFFRFIGYKELANHLFVQKSTRNQLKLFSEEELARAVAAGEVALNQQILDQFQNSLIICDEVHDVYNSTEKNNWGMAVQTVLNRNPSCRALFLSATPMNSSPTEIVDLLNLLLPRQHYGILHKKDFFRDDAVIAAKEPLLKQYLAGRVSYIRNRDTRRTPSRSMLGEAVAGVDYLRFVQCPMSKFQYDTYKGADVLGNDTQYALDYALPDPQSQHAFEPPGLFRAADVRERLTAAPAAWKSKAGISYQSKEDAITGPALKTHLPQISGKYAAVLRDIKSCIKGGKGKIFIYHNSIHMSGTIFLQEVLRHNGFVDEYSASFDDTLCALCAEPRATHTASAGHAFSPARFAIIHSEIDRGIITQSLEKFNHVSNAEGHQIMILIGSRIIRQSHSLSAVCNIFIVSRPDSISMLIQIMGRAIRIGSHRYLPRERRHVEVSIYVSCALNGQPIEALRYRDKIEAYKGIQKIEQWMHENAIDARFNYDMIWRDDTHAHEAATHKSVRGRERERDGLGILPFKLPPLKPHELNLSTFNAFYAKFEVEYTMAMIKRLFIEISPVWKYADLLAACRDPPFDVEINTEILSGDLFNIALNNLLQNASDAYTEPIVQTAIGAATTILDKVIDPNDKVITEGCMINHIGDYYVLLPVVAGDSVADVEMPFRQVHQPKSRLVSVQNFLKHDMAGNYMEKKLRFVKKWENVSINNLEMALCDFGVKFHQEFLEEVIEYIFRVWTDPALVKHEFHAFFFKMLYYYDLERLVAWGHTINNKLAEHYKGLLEPITANLLAPQDIAPRPPKDPAMTGFVNLLISSLNKNDPNWISTGMAQDYEDKLRAANALFEGVYKKSKKSKPARADFVPVGHFLGRVPRFYIPAAKAWHDEPLSSKRAEKENPIIVGYEERSKTGITVRFKLRSPAQNVKQFKDQRFIERGALCITKSKTYLQGVAKQLDIKDAGNNVESLCVAIRNKLIYNELKERIAGNPVRWFYFVYESK